MSKLARFRRLERARPDGGAAPDAGPRPVSGRFAAIEPRAAPAAAPAPDAFAPPPVATPELQLDLGTPASVAAAQRERAARAEASLAALRAEREAAAAEAPPGAQGDASRDVVVRALAAVAGLGTPLRVLLAIALLLATVVGRQVVAVVVLAPLAVAVIGASFLVVSTAHEAGGDRGRDARPRSRDDR